MTGISELTVKLAESSSLRLSQLGLVQIIGNVKLRFNEKSKFASNMFLTNAWYAAAWSHEITCFELISRNICNEKIVFYRDISNQPVALLDKCPHRFFPLSKGRITEKGLECGYHGLIYDTSGRCIHIPTQEVIPETACVKSYPLVEKHNLLWIWMGNPGLADESKLPQFKTSPGWQSGLDFSCLSDPEWSSTGDELIHVNANYQLIVDNLLDLSHTLFIHPSTFAGSEIDKADIDIRSDDNKVYDFRFIRNVAPTKFNKICHNNLTNRVDRWSNTYWSAPGTMILDHGFTNTGEDRENGACWLNVNIITPETANSSHYFWSQCRWHDKDNNALTDYWRTVTIEAFSEDEEALSLQQENMTLFDIHDLIKHRPITLGSDKSAMLARRILTNLIKLEQETGAGVV